MGAGREDTRPAPRDPPQQGPTIIRAVVQGVLLEGLEVAFIVVSFGVAAHALGTAILRGRLVAAPGGRRGRGRDQPSPRHPVNEPVIPAGEATAIRMGQ
jgi:hypothetical protein